MLDSFLAVNGRTCVEHHLIVGQVGVALRCAHAFGRLHMALLEEDVARAFR